MTRERMEEWAFETATTNATTTVFPDTRQLIAEARRARESEERLTRVIEEALRMPHADTCGAVISDSETYPCHCHRAVLARELASGRAK